MSSRSAAGDGLRGGRPGGYTVLVPPSAQRFRFRPGRPILAAVAGTLGAGLVITTLLGGPPAGRGLPIAAGVAIAVLALLYLLSPAWRTEVAVDDDGLEVLNRGDRRFRAQQTAEGTSHEIDR